ncbi:MAG: glycerophosphodiester phosphodiesterase family protein [Alphaproteobacteria bacterium]|nr:glycerophosphodiester phosphodiesterase family protein [Alphaproteobacteria bacterium]
MRTPGLIFVLFAHISVWVGACFAEDVPPPSSDAHHYIEIPPGGMPSFLKWRSVRVPLVSHHRGGPAPGFPENALETMQNALLYGPGMMEVDVATLGDGTLVLMHDDTLDRTTTGAGALSSMTWDQVKTLYLRDESGKSTNFRIPRLVDALRWAVGRAILTLDIKRGTDFERVARLIAETGAGDYVIAISYSLEQAQSFAETAPDLALSVTIRSLAELDAVKNSNLPQDRLIAWTGTRVQPQSLYDDIHAEGWKVILGTLGSPSTSLDAEFARMGVPGRYLELFQYGADVIATDRFWAAQSEIYNPNLFFFIRQRIYE